MSAAAYPSTHFPVSSLLFPTELNPLNFRHSLCLPRRCASQRLNLSCSFLQRSSRNPRKGGLLLMAEMGSRVSDLGTEDDEEIRIRVLEQEALVDGSSQFRSGVVTGGLEANLNRLSKWLVAVLFSALIVWRHDGEALWAVTGSVLNSALSFIMKRILNQERPASNLRSDPGMPSSHSQSIFYAVVFIILSMVEWHGVNELTLIFASLSLIFGSYLSWLRVSQKLHTISQVAVGAVLGSCFSLLWIWSWDAFVLEAYNSFLWVRLSVYLGFAICSLGFLFYVVRYWFTPERY